MFFPTDRNVEFPKRYKATKVPGTDDIFDLIPAPGTVLEEGDFWNLRAAQMLQADIRTYPAGRDIKAGEVLDVQEDGTLNDTKTIHTAIQEWFSILSNYGYSAVRYVKFCTSVGNGYFVYITYDYPNSPNDYSLKLGRIANGAQSNLRSVSISGEAIGLFALNRNRVCAITSNGISIYFVENEDLVLENTISYSIQSSNGMLSCAMSDEGTVVVFGSYTADGKSYVPKAITVQGVGSESPVISDDILLQNPSRNMYKHATSIYIGNGKVLHTYLGYALEDNPEALMCSIFDINSKEFSGESILAETGGDIYRSSDKPNLLMADKPYVIFVDSKSGSETIKHIFMCPVTIENSGVAVLGENTLIDSIISEMSSNNYVSANFIDKYVFITTGFTVYQFDISNNPFLLVNTIDVESGNTNNRGLYVNPHIIKIDNYFYCSITNTRSYSNSAYYNESYAYTFFMYKNELNIYPTFSASDCISLQNAKIGDIAEVIFEGITQFPGLKKGQAIQSEGVYGVGLLDGIIQAWRKERPGVIVEGSYIGTGKCGADFPTKFYFDTPIRMLIIQQDTKDIRGSNFAIFVVGNSSGVFISVSKSSDQTGISYSPLAASFDYETNVFSIYDPSYSGSSNPLAGASAVRQMNDANKQYRYIAFT